jgi:RsiW-degrading membrane proteinase PrsW (M82 family)
MQLLLIVSAIIPCLLICYYVYKRDKYEKHPYRIYSFCFLTGMLSAYLAFHLSELVKDFIDKEASMMIFYMKIFIGIAFCEEICKFFFLRVFVFRSKEFNEPYDGIAYSVIIAMGFAVVENVIYVLHYQSEEVALLRMITAIPAHGTFGSIMGYYIGMAKFNKSKSFVFQNLSIASATLIHGLYDFFIFQDKYPKFILVSISLLFLMILVTRKFGNRLKSISPFNKNE